MLTSLTLTSKFDMVRGDVTFPYTCAAGFDRIEVGRSVSRAVGSRHCNLLPYEM